MNAVRSPSLRAVALVWSRSRMEARSAAVGWYGLSSEALDGALGVSLAADRLSASGVHAVKRPTSTKAAARRGSRTTRATLALAAGRTRGRPHGPPRSVRTGQHAGPVALAYTR